jgi:hypothetical protein
MKQKDIAKKEQKELEISVIRSMEKWTGKCSKMAKCQIFMH